MTEPAYRDFERRRPGDLLIGMHCGPDVGHVTFYERNSKTRNVPRIGFWLVLRESVAGAMYLVMRSDDRGALDEGWVAVGVLEEPNYFRTVSQA